MQKKFPTTIFTTILIVVFFILEFILNGEITFLQTTNLFFIPASIFLIIGLFNLVIRSGSFDFFHYSVNKAANRFRRKNTVEEETDDQSLTKLSDHFGSSFPFFLKIGLILMSISLLALLGFYLFEQ